VAKSSRYPLGPTHDAPIARTRPDWIGWGHLPQLNKEKPLNTQELVDAVASTVDTTRTAAGEIVEAFIAVVTQAVAEGKGVQLVGSAPVVPGCRAARPRRNTRTGETLQITTPKTIKFAAGGVQEFCCFVRTLGLSS